MDLKNRRILKDLLKLIAKLTGYKGEIIPLGIGD